MADGNGLDAIGNIGKSAGNLFASQRHHIARPGKLYWLVGRRRLAHCIRNLEFVAFGSCGSDSLEDGVPAS